MVKFLRVGNYKSSSIGFLYLIALCTFFSLQAQAQIVGVDPSWLMDPSSPFKSAIFGVGATPDQRVGLIYYDEGDSNQFEHIVEDISKSLGLPSDYSPADFEEGEIPIWILVRAGSITAESGNIAYCIEQPAEPANDDDFCTLCQQFPQNPDCQFASLTYKPEQKRQILESINPASGGSEALFPFETFRPAVGAELPVEVEAIFRNVAPIAIEPNITPEGRLNIVTASVVTSDSDAATRAMELLLTPSLQKAFTDGTKYVPALIDESLNNVP